mgnify:CR=1 FL=1
MQRPRLTLVRIEVDASWQSLLVSVLTAAGVVGLALWWIA